MMVKTLLLLLVVLCTSGCLKGNSAELRIAGSTMGTTYSITVVAPPSNVQQSTLQQQIEAEFATINQQISNWDSGSELSVFNASESTEWVPLSDSTITMVQSAVRISKETDGAYDVTLGSISELWGFGPRLSTAVKDDAELAVAAATPQVNPSLDDILRLMNNVGYQLLQVSSRDASLRKLTPGLQVDLSSIGKGYAVDRVGEILESQAINRYMVEIGGEIRTRGRAADGGMWKIGIEMPATLRGNIKKGLAVENAHIASSGDYRNYREVDGQRVSHLIDGRSGFPISHNLAAVTLLHGSVMQADAWATALMVLGYEEGLKVAQRKGLAVQFTVREGETFQVYTTKAFDAYAYTEK